MLVNLSKVRRWTQWALLSALGLAAVFGLPAGAVGQESAPIGLPHTMPANDPPRPSIQDLQAELAELLRKGYLDGDAQKQVEALIKEIARRRALKDEISQEIAEDRPNVGERRDLAALEADLAAKAKQLAVHEGHLRQLTEYMLRSEARREAPVIEGAVAQIFGLRHARANEAAGTIESLFGAQVRVAVDDRTNSLVISGNEKSLEAVRALLGGLDDSAAEGDGESTGPSARTALLRIFWLADGLPADEGQDPAGFLPPAVIDATARLGLREPRLVTQTVNSLAVGEAAEVEFKTSVPATIFGQLADFQTQGSLRAIGGDRARLDVSLSVSGGATNCELQGSLATPLGHFMVLGTANSVVATPAAAGDPRMGREMADPSAAVPGGEGFTPPGMAPGTAPTAAAFNTSRFAFVVQVIEGESFPAAP